VSRLQEREVAPAEAVEHYMTFWNSAKAFAGLFVCACGAGESGSVEGVDPEDGARIDAEAQRVRQALGEATCPTTAADVTWANPFSGNQSIDSPSANYDHPTCRNAFIVDVPGVRASTQFSAGVPGSAGVNPFCGFEFAYIGLYRKQGATYVKVTESFNLGRVISFPQFGTTCAAISTVVAPADGDYKLVTSAGAFFFGYSTVFVTAT
jgi:hypothetical protein